MRRAPRADAVRSKAAIVDAAVVVLGRRPDATVEHVAASAGVSRQTVYAHFPSRDALLAAAVDRATDDAIAAIDAAGIDEGPATEALLRVIDASWDFFQRHRILLGAAAAHTHPAEDAARHVPVATTLERLIRRGQAEGDIDSRWDETWLVNAIIALGHAAGVCVHDGTMTSDEAEPALRESLLRLVCPACG